MRDTHARVGAVGLAATLLTVALGLASGARGDSFIVEGGKAKAEIVVAEDPPRMVDLAAKELRLFVMKMTGAKLPVVNEPGDVRSVKIYVGESKHTDKLGVSAESLKHGAFRMDSGDKWLALVGDDYDYEPREPMPRSHADSARAQKAWEALTGSTWLNPMAHTYKAHHREFGYWQMDQGGSLNAVYDFLRSLGVRWYLPGELGEVVPKLESIPLPSVRRTVRPSFALRCLKWTSYAALDWDDLIWDRRMGLNRGYQVWGAGTYRSHGIRAVIGHERMQEAYPEYYALIGGRRQTDRRGTGRPCLRSEGLIRETVAYCRAVFDHYDGPMVSIWPTDGFKQCQCDLCRDIDNVSDYVWGFVDRVAREVYRTHPERKVSCGAYDTYAPPPPGIGKLPPNVVVYIANRGRPSFGDPERWRAYWQTVEAWRGKVAPGNVIRGENNLLTMSYGGRSGPVPFPTLHPREYVKDLKALRGICMGERNEVSRGVRRSGKAHTWRAPGLDHLNFYVNAQFLWDVDQDIDAVLDEYYRLFYGPAAREMKAAFELADDNFPAKGPQATVRRMPPMEVRARFVEMLHTARAAAGDAVYGRRVQLILDELPTLEQLRLAAALAQQRGDDVITFDRLMHGEEYHGLVKTFNPDGKLDERFWQNYPHGRSLRAAGGRSFKTSFMARWVGDHIYFGIHCDEDTNQPLNIATTRDDDPAILEGDHVELLIETSPANRYRIVVNPAAALMDLDMTAKDGGARWSSNADIGAHVGDGYWSVELKLKVVNGEEGGMDHLNYLAGGRPTSAWPWYFNVGRVRMRENEARVTSYSPIGDSDLTNRTRFARLLLRRDAQRLIRDRKRP